jgi:hypothetical protein
MLELIIAAASLFGYGFWFGVYCGRRHERTRRIALWARRLARRAPPPVQRPNPTLAAIEINLAGRAVRTDVCIDTELLEQFANGLGRYTTNLPSRTTQ